MNPIHTHKYLKYAGTLLVTYFKHVDFAKLQYKSKDYKAVVCNVFKLRAAVLTTRIAKTHQPSLKICIQI